jgi:OOP family OmpA-OmpF porin
MQAQSMGTLNSIYTMLKKDPALKFEIDGHTDNTGSASHNLSLSQNRAEAVKMKLVNMGIEAERLSAKGFGDSKPLGANDTPEDKANNRRVEFVKI